MKKTILVVEDEASLGDALRDKFEREGFKVLVAKNGKVGLEVAIKEKPDLILLDIVMPVMDGITMLTKLRTESEWGKTVQVIILTNLISANEQLNRNISELEPSLYLVKSDWKIEDVVEKAEERLKK